MITEPDRLAAEAVARGEPLPPALEYTLLVEEFKHACGQERQKIWERIEQLKNQNRGRIP